MDAADRHAVDKILRIGRAVGESMVFSERTEIDRGPRSIERRCYTHAPRNVKRIHPSCDHRTLRPRLQKLSELFGRVQAQTLAQLVSDVREKVIQLVDAELFDTVGDPEAFKKVWVNTLRRPSFGGLGLAEVQNRLHEYRDALSQSLEQLETALAAGTSVAAPGRLAEPLDSGTVEPFVPTALQQGILRALDGTALKTEALAKKVGALAKELPACP